MTRRLTVEQVRGYKGADHPLVRKFAADWLDMHAEVARLKDELMAVRNELEASEAASQALYTMVRSERDALQAKLDAGVDYEAAQAIDLACSLEGCKHGDYDQHIRAIVDAAIRPQVAPCGQCGEPLFGKGVGYICRNGHECVQFSSALGPSSPPPSSVESALDEYRDAVCAQWEDHKNPHKLEFRREARTALLAAVAAEVEKAVRAERERYATVALAQRCESGTAWTNACNAVAKAIRGGKDE